MKKCELCKYPAKTYCEFDEASLCWGCDAKVHGANFLVARHTRTLLCRSCQSLTPWKASGSRLGCIVSVCDVCANDANRKEDEKEEESEAALDSVGDGDNQVVPWPSSTALPPPASSSSRTSSQQFCASDTIKSLKRTREGPTDLRYPLQEDGMTGAGGGGSGGDEEVNSVVDYSLKERRIEANNGKIIKRF
ncbi:hypothetical protein RCOM_0506950 [Ricinus communis]|uniref:B box-type domain-containing protein n=1 Tax=Ricinus communis TaxID=3988 RepID=B9S9P7_RICCO|nr:hypothetical protein RCOM_0506950 [Ricinus communis]|eukprot:XP_002522716.1 zinc finger protein CONSTANS-LIKE 4 [Ricinus communis]